MMTIRWATPNCPLDGRPNEIVRLLASEDGITRGYGYGPGWSMVFGSEQGDVVVYPGQYVTRHDDGTITVSDEPPSREPDAAA